MVLYKHKRIHKKTQKQVNKWGPLQGIILRKAWEDSQDNIKWKKNQDGMKDFGKIPIFTLCAYLYNYIYLETKKKG